jgi:putative FmdB family regulatory protein
MPIYEYHCWRCDIRTEVIKQNMADRETDTCPKCGAKIKMVPSVPVMHPDSYWSGHVDPTLGYVTSKSELKRKEKAAGIRRKDPGDAAAAKLVQASREHKEDEVRREVIGESVRELDLPIGA